MSRNESSVMDEHVCFAEEADLAKRRRSVPGYSPVDDGSTFESGHEGGWTRGSDIL